MYKYLGVIGMKMRPPAIPLITVDPYFSVWSSTDKLYDSETVHWTNSPNPIKGTVAVDNKTYRFMGLGEENAIEQTYFSMNAFVSEYAFENNEIKLNVKFYTPLIPDDLYLVSRPVSYVTVNYDSLDDREHEVKVCFEVSEEICIDKIGAKQVNSELFSSESLLIGKMGSAEQNILNSSGDDLRIDWGYFYLACSKNGEVKEYRIGNVSKLSAEVQLDSHNAATVLFAYDDIYSINYFGNFSKAYWKTKNADIVAVLEEAYRDAFDLLNKCYKFSCELEAEAKEYGGEKYADLLTLAFRQVIAAHKLAVDSDGNVIFISKECFSNGCAATVDVTYPSSPFFLKYNIELLKGMLRPIFKFALSDEWEFDFAPHDVGQYPLVLGQVYGSNHKEEGRYKDFQMPVEECGNMLIMMANIAIHDGSVDFFNDYKDVLSQWVKYLIEYGMDPEHQLCTDDFAGHLAHNCNLSLKAIMGIAAYSILLKMADDESAEVYMKKASEMATEWVKNAANDDGSFRLTFDRENTFSMKYNMIWDKLWKLNLFAPCVYNSEFSSNKKHINAYGMPLDNRKTYTKSDWLLWTACLSSSKEEFESFIEPMWNCYNVTPSRVPMTDWYDTVTSQMVGFRHRSVQGGLFIGLLFGE